MVISTWEVSPLARVVLGFVCLAAAALAAPLGVTLRPPATSRVGVPFAARVEITGGTAPYAIAVAMGTLPPGVSLNSSTGEITGTPTAAGTFVSYIRVTDSQSATAGIAAQFAVESGAPAIKPVTQPLAANAGKPFSFTPVVSGGVPPYDYDIASGELPPGLELNWLTGEISGTPTSAGTFLFVLRAWDSDSISAATGVAIVVFGPMSITTGGLPDAKPRAPYLQTLKSSGGSAAPLRSWIILSGELPPGLELDGRTGQIAGVPEGPAGVHTFTVKVTDADGASAARTLSIAVRVLEIVAKLLPDAVAGSPYAYTLIAAGGKPPFSWLQGSGMPEGLALSAAGVLSGTPRTAGNHQVEIAVTDGEGNTARADLPLRVSPPLTQARPAIAENGILNRASGKPGIAPGALVTIVGQNLAPAPGRTIAAEDVVEGWLPLTLESVTVRINGKPAPIHSVGPTELNVQAPDDDSLGSVLVEVETANGAAQSTADLLPAAPALFTAAARGAGGKYAAVVDPEGTAIADPSAIAGARPARPDEIVLVYGTGFGPTAPARAAGHLCEPAPLANGFEVFIGGVKAVAEWGGIVGVGLYQFNVRVPTLPDGDHEVIVEIGGMRSQSAAYLAVKN